MVVVESVLRLANMSNSSTPMPTKGSSTECGMLEVWFGCLGELEMTFCVCVSTSKTGRFR